jgi:hypothetical protein
MFGVSRLKTFALVHILQFFSIALFVFCLLNTLCLCICTVLCFVCVFVLVL